ncbi:MAG: tRNA 2-thiouridine(34) synthase MnmA, partial [Gammaproteobacteria bacterium]|nr:tRNA 2-thiouridine(34) synthase MnmA [Gammaproteobacteria bacterium]
MLCGQIFWINESPPLPYSGTVKTRYRQPDQECTLSLADEGNWLVEFETPQRAVTPGQWACFYEGDICLGGGIITSNLSSIVAAL